MSSKKTITDDKYVYESVSGWLKTHYTMENNSRNLFFTISGALAAVFLGLYDKISEYLLLIFAIFGFFITTLWYQRLSRNNFHGDFYLNTLIEIEKRMFSENLFKVFTRRDKEIKDQSRSSLSTTEIMGLFPIIWIFLIIFSLYSVLKDIIIS